MGVPAAVREYSDTLLIFLLKGRNSSAILLQIAFLPRYADDKELQVAGAVIDE